MSLVLHLLLLLLLPFPCFAIPEATEFLYPNVTFAPFNLVDNPANAFLSSPSNLFSAVFDHPGTQQSRYYFSLKHTPSSAIVWSANPNAAVPAPATLSLNLTGLSLSFPNGTPAWSTPTLASPVAALRLLDTGNLQLLDAANRSLWQSFDHPTDTVLPGQLLPAGGSLSAAVSATDFSDAGYRLLVTSSDAVLRWGASQQYWALSSDRLSVKNINAAVSSLAVNATGLYLLDASRVPRVVFQVIFQGGPAGFRYGKLDYDGRFRIISYDSVNASATSGDGFSAPSSDCDLPFRCQTLGFCTVSSNGSNCGCSSSLDQAPGSSACLPADGSALASSNSSSCGQASSISYLGLGSGVGYFANRFSTAATVGEDITACESLCTQNCSCLGFFYRNSSRSCYLLKDRLGSLSSVSTTDNLGFIKTIASPSSSPPGSAQSSSSSTNLLPILLPSIAMALLLLVISFLGYRWWRKRRGRKGGSLPRNKFSAKEIRLGRSLSEDEFPGDGGDDDDISIPGLPARFTYADLAEATASFETKIGSGGFGEVYKGQLPDKSLVAVKKITNIGLRGRREFCTEIAVIGKIHHVNLVKLRGFCAQGRSRLLVYEYMNRGSLDRPLFGPGGPPLEWQERLDIAIGAARGLAYLHTGCDQKIIHCDVKPENILLADGGQVKIADFGMAKLMSPEQSGFFTTMRGTRGYLAPEWLTNSAISDRTDVYSYGMVLLELVRGRKNRPDMTGSTGGSGQSSGSGRSTGGGEYFPAVAVEWHERGKYKELADPRMEGRVDEEEVGRAVRVALCCLHEEPARRPSMAAVVNMLEGTAPVWEPRVESLGFLRLYGRGEGTAAAAAGMMGLGNFSGSATSSGSSGPPLSYMSSQQVSGPR